MTITIRPARAEELELAQALVVGSINDLTVRHGFGPMATARPPAFQLFSLRDDPRGLWTAEDAGEMVGFAFSWASADLWFLAELFVAPDRQGQSIGRELLRKTLQHASDSGAATRALITFTFNRTSQALYIKHGFFPRTPVYMFSGARDAIAPKLESSPLRHVRIEDTPAHRRELARVDGHVLSTNRDKHHGVLVRDPTMHGALLYAADECVGYAYVNSAGHIGPLATIRASAAGPAFATALGLAADQGAAQISAFIPGANEAALAAAVACGMKILFPMLLMSSRPFGDWSQYAPRNPGFM